VIVPVAFFLAFRVWSPVVARGLYPYSEKFTEAEQWETEEAEARALLCSFQIGCAVIIADILIDTPRYLSGELPVSHQYLVLSTAFFVYTIFVTIGVKKYRRKKSAERNLTIAREESKKFMRG
jgi:hypothetical protein